MKYRYYIVFGLLAVAALGALAWGQFDFGGRGRSFVPGSGYGERERGSRFEFYFQPPSQERSYRRQYPSYPEQQYRYPLQPYQPAPQERRESPLPQPIPPPEPPPSTPRMERRIENIWCEKGRARKTEFRLRPDDEEEDPRTGWICGTLNGVDLIDNPDYDFRLSQWRHQFFFRNNNDQDVTVCIEVLNLNVQEDNPLRAVNVDGFPRNFIQRSMIPHYLLPGQVVPAGVLQEREQTPKPEKELKLYRPAGVRFRMLVAPGRRDSCEWWE